MANEKKGIIDITTGQEISDADVRYSIRPENVLVVTKTPTNNGDYSDPKTAIEAASSGDTVRIFSGTYACDPISIPSGVIVEGIGRTSARITANNNNSPLFTMGANSVINGLYITGPTNDSAIYVAGGTSNTFIENTSFISGSVAIESTGSSSRVTVEECKMYPSVTTAMEATSGGRIDCSNILSFATTMAKADGTNSEIWMHNSGQEGGTNGIYADNGALIRPYNISISSTTNVVRIGSTGTGTEIEGGGVFSRNGGSTKDIYNESSDGTIRLTNCLLDADKFDIANWDNLSIDYNNDKEGDKGFHILKELHTGCPEKGTEAALGQGDSYTRGMLVYKEVSSVFTDVSDDAKSPSGSTFTYGTGNNDALYVGCDLQNDSDYLQFYGIKASITTAAVLGSGEIVAERWNGSAWEVFGQMSCQSNPPVLPYGDQIFERTGSEQIRFGPCMIEDWTKNDPPTTGTNRWWVRFRNNGAITTAPVFEQFKLHCSRYEVNSDGWVEYFGLARPIAKFPWSMGDAKAWGSSPLNQDLYMLNSTSGVDYDLGVGLVENSFQPDARDRIGISVPCPFDLDTSCNISLRIYWMVTSANAGNIQWRISAGVSSVGDGIATDVGSAPTSIAGEYTYDELEAIGAGEDGVIKTKEFLIPVRKCISRYSDNYSDIISISLVRDGNNAADTYDGIVNLHSLSAYYYKWCEGGHFNE